MLGHVGGQRVLGHVHVQGPRGAPQIINHWNDAGGYDIITLPSGTTTRVFTKEEYRIGADGATPAARGRGRGGGRGKGRKSGGRGRSLLDLYG